MIQVLVSFKVIAIAEIVLLMKPSDWTAHIDEITHDRWSMIHYKKRIKIDHRLLTMDNVNNVDDEQLINDENYIALKQICINNLL